MRDEGGRRKAECGRRRVRCSFFDGCAVSAKFAACGPLPPPKSPRESIGDRHTLWANRTGMGGGRSMRLWKTCLIAVVAGSLTVPGLAGPTPDQTSPITTGTVTTATVTTGKATAAPVTAAPVTTAPVTDGAGHYGASHRRATRRQPGYNRAGRRQCGERCPRGAAGRACPAPAIHNHLPAVRRRPSATGPRIAANHCPARPARRWATVPCPIAANRCLVRLALLRAVAACLIAGNRCRISAARRLEAPATEPAGSWL